jgi:hypothetical protein
MCQVYINIRITCEDLVLIMLGVVVMHYSILMFYSYIDIDVFAVK